MTGSKGVRLSKGKHSGSRETKLTVSVVQPEPGELNQRLL